MIESQFSVRCLEASEGYLITQAADVPDSARMVGKRVILGVNDSPSNWKEITALEAARIRTLQGMAAVTAPLPDIDEPAQQSDPE